jgi:hypothetical protein
MEEIMHKFRQPTLDPLSRRDTLDLHFNSDLPDPVTGVTGVARGDNCRGPRRLPLRAWAVMAWVPGMAVLAAVVVWCLKGI